MNVVAILIVLVFVYIQVLVIEKGRSLSGALVAAIIFCLNTTLFLLAVYRFHLITDSGSVLDGPSAIDQVIHFNLISTEVRNSAISVALALLSYGLYRQYKTSQSIAYGITSFIVGALTLVFILGSMMTYMFTI